MRNYVIRRLLAFPLILFAISVITFSLVRLLPGDAAVARLGATGAQCDECFEQVRRELGLDKSNIEQYWMWASSAIRGDFGLSTSTRQPVSPELRSRFMNTFRLGVFTIVLTVVIGVPLGVVAGVKHGTVTDYVARCIRSWGLSVRCCWIARLVRFMPLSWWGWTPLRDFVSFRQDPVDHMRLLFLPALVLAIAGAAYVARITRSSMLETLTSDHVRTARAKGLHERVVVTRHVFRNSMLTLLTVIGLQFGIVLGGSVIIESIFTLPGMGAWLVMAVNNRDYQIVQAVAVVFAFWFLTITLITDILYAWVDPRIRY